MTTTNNYVGAAFDYTADKVLIWERDENGRHIVRYDPPRYFYLPDEDGTFTSIYGDKLARHDFFDDAEFKAACRRYAGRTFESDISPLFKVLMEWYYEHTVPTVHYAFIDIENDYESAKNYATMANPYAPINAVTIYQSWTNEYKIYAVPPKGWDSYDTFDKDFAAFAEEHKFGFVPTVTLCRNERELLNHLIEDIQDSDILSGWNSEFFDLPYIIKRLEIAAPHLIKKLSFIGARMPKEGFVNRYGQPELTYKLSGRTHLDYLDLFKKFTFGGRTSYSLANIANDELDVPKIEYDGTLEQLYHNDFVHFVGYNFRDVQILVKLDEKFRFIRMVNQMAHENTSLYENMLGTVKYVETGITNRAHYIHNLIVPDKKIINEEASEKVEGAVVLNPRVGMYPWVGSVDINSLYPKTTETLNISPEMFMGQFEGGEASWRGIKNKDNKEHTLVDDYGETITMTGAEWYEVLHEQKWAITAYGSVFDQSRGIGIVPEALSYLYTERLRLQAEKKKWGKEVTRLEEALKLDPDNSKLISDLEFAEVQFDLFDLLQHTKKIQLNSIYGAMLNKAFRLGRKEMGASVTACGRQITLGMMERIHYLSTGEHCRVVKIYRSLSRPKPIFSTRQEENYTPTEEEMDVAKRLMALHPIGKAKYDDDGVLIDDANQNLYFTTSDIIIYSDTDSCYFKTNASNKEEAIEIADTIAAATNEGFAEFVRNEFFVQPGHDKHIKAGREVVAIRGLFQAKKKYILRVVDMEGKSVDKLKSMGSEIKKADTPKVIQDFLKGLMDHVLDGAEYPVVETYVNTQRKNLLGKSKDIFSMGVSKQVNNLDEYYSEWKRTEKVGKGKAKLPGHVRSSINYNELALEHETNPTLLKAGDKIILFYLKKNYRNIKAIAFPADITHFPKWFNDEFEVDRKLTEEKMIDSKLEGIFEALQWDIPTPQNTLTNKLLSF